MAKQVSNDLRKLLLALKLTPKNYTGILVNGRRISAAVAADVVTYATPQPALADVDAALDNVDLALQTKGSKKNRSSKADIDLVIEKAGIARGLLIQLLEYITITVSDLNLPVLSAQALLIQAGSAAQNPFATTGKRFLPVRNLKLVNNRAYPVTMRRFTWEKPAGQRGAKKPDSYQVYISDGVADPRHWATVTKTSIEFPDGFPFAGPSPVQIIVAATGRTGLGIPATITVPFIAPVV